MRRKSSFKPLVTSLEDRLAPAISITTPLNVNGDVDLLITSVPGPATSSVRVLGGVNALLAPALDTYVVQHNGGAFVAFGPITGNVILNLDAFPGSLNPAGVGVEFNLLNGEELEGDLRIAFAANQGGNHVIQIDGSAGLFGSGAIIGGPAPFPGNVAITTGTGNDLVLFFLGGPNDVHGAVTVNTGAGDDLVLHFGGTIANHVTITNANQFAAGFAFPSLIQGNLTYRNVTDPTNVAGNVTLAADATVRGNVTIQTNARDDSVVFAGVILGNTSLALGGGANDFTMTAASLVNRNLTYVGGNQRDVVDLEFGSTVMGNAGFRMGNSGSTSPLANVLELNGAIWGSSILVYGGNGRDEVLFDAFAQGAYLKCYLYSGNDDLTLGASTVLARAWLDGGFGVDSFTSFLSVIAFPTLLRYFP